MACHHEHHKTLTNGVGKCGVPMWSGGCPAGFCDEPAYGNQEPNQMRYGTFERGRWYPGYSSALTCHAHGGPEKPARALLDAEKPEAGRGGA